MLSRLIDGGLRILDQERLVRESGFWDAAWYAARYPEAGSADRALTHFLRVGAGKGHDPGPDFSMSAYLSENPDVREAGANPLVHYLRFGRYEGRVARDSHGRPTGGAAHGLNDEALDRVRTAFDARFYRATNPDLPEEIDALEHFLGPGWCQRRDPAPWFSVERYLRVHEDVAGEGTNPFVHYVLTGCREGRAVTPSARREVARTAPRARHRLAAVAMVRNEADVIRSFAAHLLALFDEIVIVDHRSDDGTSAYLEELARRNHRVEILTLEEPSYIQSVTMTHVVRDRPQLRSADWVFLLDADEFLPFADRAAFEAALSRFDSCPVVAMRWRNLIPGRYWKGEVRFSDGASFLIPPAPSPFRKVAFQPARVPLDRIAVAQGNHGLVETLNGVELPVFDADFPLLHLPVRSSDQILLKLNQGVLAYQKIGRQRDAAQGTHWYQMKEATEGAALSPDHLNAMAERYSEDKPKLVPVSRSELMAAGYDSREVVLAQSEEAFDVGLDRRSLGELLMRLHSVDYSHAATEDRPGAARLLTEGARLVRADDAPEYSALPETIGEDREVSAVGALSALFRSSYADIEDLVPSDWTGHIPFMVALTSLMRPRRFVEIGTLRGASFFAVCQAALRGGARAEAVAISPWAVEPERAAEFGAAYEDFRFIARKYAESTGILRMSASDALHRFADGSVDLMHLDGFRSYEEAAETFAAWHPKLSDRGVVLVHDIAAHGPGFGVWRFWEELRSEVPSFEFDHAQGLGIACLGEAAPAELEALARAHRSDRALRTLMQEHFERLGALSSELFSRRYDMAQMDMRAGAEGALAEELSWLRQELSSARAEADDLREMVKGGLRHATTG